MRALTFWKTVTADRSDFLERLVFLLQEAGIAYCVIGGQAVNAYVEPVVSLDLDLAVATDQMETVESLLSLHFTIQRFTHSLNVSAYGADLRVQIQTDPRYADFVQRASSQEVLGIVLPVAALEDVLQGKVWAVQDTTRRASERQKDLADIARLLETYPELRDRVPETILVMLL